MNERVSESSHRLNESLTDDHKVHAYVTTNVRIVREAPSSSRTLAILFPFFFYRSSITDPFESRGIIDGFYSNYNRYFNMQDVPKHVRKNSEDNYLKKSSYTSLSKRHSFRIIYTGCFFKFKKNEIAKNIF